MDRSRVREDFDDQLRRRARPGDPGGRTERAGAVVREIGAGPDDWNGVVWSDLDAGTADAAIAEQAAFFGSLGRELEWKVYGHDRPRDLPDRLAAAGFVPGECETLMAAEIAELPAFVEPPPGVTLRQVTDAAGVELVVDVHERAFGAGAHRLRARLLGQLARGSGTLGMTLAMAGDLPVAAARMELYPGTDFAGLWGGGTVPGWRGRGVYRALVAHRARAAAEAGHRYLQVDASRLSRPILARLGFTALGTTTPYTLGP